MMNRFYFILLALAFCLPAGAQVIINEFSAANRTVLIDNYGRAEDWIELHNLGAAPVNLGGYFMSDKLDNPTKWEIPNGVTIGPGEYLIALASKRDEFSGGYLHTNFNVTQTQNNEYVILADPAGNILDAYHVDIPNQLNHSYGRQTDGALNWVIFPTPTPGAPNGGTFYTAYASRPSLSLPAGFYNGLQSVVLSTTEPNITIRYTLNGSDPTPTSPIYSGPIFLDGTTVLRARAYSSNPSVWPSLINTRTYFIDDSSTLPVVSIAGNQILTLMNGSQIEPTGSFELFDETGSRVCHAVGEYNKHGNDSWAYQQRGIDYITRDQFGYDYALRHQIFPNKTRNRFQRVMLKAAANDNYPFGNGAHIRDAYVQTLSQNANLELDERTNLNCLLFVNGEYWGVYEIREKVDDPDFTEYYYGQNRLNIDYIKTWGGTWFEYNSGSGNEWYTLHDYITGNDMSVQANYEYVKTQLNVLSLIDYMILNTHIVSKDWLNWNTAWWRGRHPEGQALTWRYTLWDMDASFGHYTNYTGIPNQTPTAQPCDNEVYPPWGDPQGHVDLIVSLMESEEFHALYVNRYADLLNTYLSCDYMIALLDQMIAHIAPEMPRQIARWGGNMGGWQTRVNTLRNFILQRCIHINNGIVDCYDVEGPYPLVLMVEPENSGNQVSLNTMTPDVYPFEGDYFGGVNLSLQAQPAPNWVFDHWEVANNSFGPDEFAQAILLAMQQADTVIAYFVPLELFSEIDTIICAPDCFPYEGDDYCASGQYTFQFTTSSGLDSTVYLNLTVLQTEATIEVPGMLGCDPNASVPVDAGNSSTLPSTPGATLSYAWSGPVGGLSGPTDALQVTVTLPGTYTLLVTQELEGISCSASANVLVEQLEPTPLAPGLSGAGEACLNEVLSYALSPPASGPAPTGYTWAVSGGTFAELGNTIEVTWTGPAGQVCVSGFNDCGPGEQTCLDVLVHTPPTAVLSGGGAICQGSGDCVALSLNLTGSADWTLSFSLDGAPQPAQSFSSANPTLEVCQAGTYALLSVSDNHGCAGSVSGTAQVVEHDAPSVGNLEVICNGLSTAYTLSFEIGGGDSGTYSVTGLSGSISAIAPYVFTSDPIPSGSGYTFTVNDANNCAPSSFSSAGVACDCTTAAGSMGGAMLSACSEESITAAYNSAGQMLDPDDVLVFVLHTSPGTNLSSTQVLGYNSTPSFSFDAQTMVCDITYYISAVVGDELVPGSGVVNPADPCLAMTPGTPVRWHCTPSGTLSADAATICRGALFELSFEFSGAGPYTLVVDQGNQSLTLPDMVPVSVYTAPLWETTTFTLNSITDQTTGCSSNAGNSVTIEVDEVIAELGWTGELNCYEPIITLGGGNTSQGSQYLYVWTNESGQQVAQTLLFNADVAGTYTLTVTNSLTGCQASDTGEITGTSSYPQAEIQSSDVRCHGENNGSIRVLSITGGKPPYEVSLDAGPVVSLLEFQGLAPGNYVVNFVDVNDCYSYQSVSITEPEELLLSLSGQFSQPDQQIFRGEQALLLAETNPPANELVWAPANLINCPGCSENWVSPMQTTLFSVEAFLNGCMVREQLLVRVLGARQVYVPNVFSPNNDGINDHFFLQSGGQVSRVRNLRIFNRWGELLLERLETLPDDPSQGWDGSFRGKPVPAGVYIYHAVVEYSDGSTEALQGDVTVVR
jgi:gliding motility-associated-like protein